MADAATMLDLASFLGQSTAKTPEMSAAIAAVVAFDAVGTSDLRTLEEGEDETESSKVSSRRNG